MRTSVLGYSMATMLLRGASFGIRVLCVLIIARKVGPHLFGTIAIMFTMAEVARVLADAGVDTFMVRSMAIQRGEDLARSIGAALSAKAMLGGLIGVSLALAMFRLNPATPILNLLMALLALSPLLLNLGANYFIATRQTDIVAVPVVSMTIGVAAVFGATMFLSDAITVGIAIVAVYELALGGWLVRRVLVMNAVRPIMSAVRALRLLGRSMPLGVAIAVGYAYGKLDVFILDRFCGKEAVGQYSFWSRLLDPFLFVCGTVAVTAYGHLSAAIQKGNAQTTKGIARRYALLNLFVSGSVAVVLTIGGGHLARAFFPSYASTLWIGRLLGLLLMLRSLNSVLTACLQAADRRSLVMLVTLLNFAVALIACTSLAPVAGTLGVVGGLIIMECVNTVVQLTFARAIIFPVTTVARSPSVAGGG